MPRPRKAKPDYCLDKSSGRAYVTLDGNRKYLGRHPAPESLDKYDPMIGEWIARGRTWPALQSSQKDQGPTVSEVIAAFWGHAQQAYPPPTPARPGKMPAGKLGNFWSALKPLRRLYGPTPALQFGPLSLKAARDEMIKLGWCRSNINRQFGRVKMVFSWAVEQELLPGESLYRLQAVKGLRRRHSAAKESKPVRPVPAPHIDAVLPHVSDQIGAIIKLELLCGARGGELCAMRVCDIDKTRDVWTYKPEQHKTAHLGHERVIRFGEKCQQILQPFITGKFELASFVFSPVDAEQQQRAKMTKVLDPKYPWTLHHLVRHYYKNAIFEVKDWQWILPHLRNLMKCDARFIPHVMCLLSKDVEASDRDERGRPIRERTWLLDREYLAALVPDHDEQISFTMELVKEIGFPDLDEDIQSRMRHLQEDIDKFVHEPRQE